MLRQRWVVAIFSSFVINALVLAGVVYGLASQADREPIYMEVTLTELFSPVESVANPRLVTENLSASSVPQPQRDSSVVPSSEAVAVVSPVTGHKTTGTTLQAPIVNGGGATNVVKSGTNRGPQVVFSTEPAYPENARVNGWQGTVRLRILVNVQGQVEDAIVAVSSGYDGLDQAAVKSIRNWQFSPALQNGQPVAAWVMLPVVFSLR